MTEATEAEPSWITITEAATRTGRHIDAVRAAVRRGRMEARKNNAGQWLVRLPAADDSGLPRAASGDDSAHDSASHGHGSANGLGGPVAALGDALGMVATIERLHQELADARVAAASAMAERDAAQAVAAAEREAIQATARADVATARADAALAEARAAAEVRAHEQMVAELRTELARLRRPWWRRVLG